MFAISHNNREDSYTKGTIVLNVPEKEFLNNLFTEHGTVTLIKTGSVVLHPKEQYNKRLGVKLATEKMEQCPAYFKYVEIRGTRHIYHFQIEVLNRCPDNNIYRTIAVGFSTTRESNHVKLVYAKL